MNREIEIKIIIQHLKNDVIRIAAKYPNLLADRIVENGKYIDAYKKELVELEKNKIAVISKDELSKIKFPKLKR